ncbi:MAG: serine/threonine-protein kinase [Planctomycetota bacterium]
MAADRIVPGFDIVSKISEGLTTIIYHAIRVRDSAKVVLRVLKPELIEDKDEVKSIQRQAKILSELNQPNIIKMNSFVENGISPAIELEFFEGESIRSLLLRAIKIPFLMRLKIAKQLAAAVAYLHEKEIVHKEIRTENLLLSELYETRLVGFSSVLTLKDLKWQKFNPFKKKTQDINIRLAPEEISGEAIGLFTDVYYCGSTLYTLFTEKLPFQKALLQKTAPDLPIPPRRFCPELSEDLEKIILKMLEKNQKNRFPDMQTGNAILSPAIDRDIYKDA